MPLKPVDCKILFELMKDSHRSDREVGRVAGISQPTISRRRLRLEKNIIYAYTVLPKLGKCGFELAAFTFGAVSHVRRILPQRVALKGLRKQILNIKTE